MRITVSVELEDTEFAQAGLVREQLEVFSGNRVSTRVVCDRSAISERISLALQSRTPTEVLPELQERLNMPETFADTADVLCSCILFNSQRTDEDVSAAPFIELVKQLLPQPRASLRAEIVQRAIAFLSTQRRIDCSRRVLLPYADTLATMVQLDVLSLHHALESCFQLIHHVSTRTAGVTCLCKLVELAMDKLQQCEVGVLQTIQSTVIALQKEEAYAYDVEYILESFGWLQSKPFLRYKHTGASYRLPILAMSCCTRAKGNDRLVTASADGVILTCDGSGQVTGRTALSYHYASSLDLTNSGSNLVVAIVARDRERHRRPAVVLYAEEAHEWCEVDSTEPQDTRLITAVRSFRADPSSLRYCLTASRYADNALLLYDHTSQTAEYKAHTDVITALHVPSTSPHMVLTGSRDCTTVLYDVRARQPSATLTAHTSTVSAIGTVDDYIFTAGLDKRVVLGDIRMQGSKTHLDARELSSAPLSLAVHTSVNSCVVSTTTGLYTVSFATNTGSARVDCGQASPWYHAIAWNQGGTTLYAAGDNNGIDVFEREGSDGL